MMLYMMYIMFIMTTKIFFFNFLNFIFIKNLKTDFKNYILALKTNTQLEITCENKKILE